MEPVTAARETRASPLSSLVTPGRVHVRPLACGATSTGAGNVWKKIGVVSADRPRSDVRVGDRRVFVDVRIRTRSGRRGGSSPVRGVESRAQGVTRSTSPHAPSPGA